MKRWERGGGTHDEKGCHYGSPKDIFSPTGYTSDKIHSYAKNIAIRREILHISFDQ